MSGSARGVPRRAFAIACTGLIAALALFLATNGGSAGAATALDPLDTSHCAGDTQNKDAFELPKAEDEEENPPDAGAAAPTQAGSAHQPQLRPLLRQATKPGDTWAFAAYAEGADAGISPPGIEVDMAWCVAEPTNDHYQLDQLDQRLDYYSDAAIPIGAIRIAEPPDWAIANDCAGDLEASPPKVTLCPPKDGKEADLREFARQLATHYGPGGPAERFGVERLEFWNEPNIPKHWGCARGHFPDSSSETDRHCTMTRRGAAIRYSALLSRVYNGAQAGNPAIAVDAGEISAPGDHTHNQVKPWATDFTDYNHANNQHDCGYTGTHDCNYDVLTIHPYSEWASNVIDRVINYRRLAGVDAVGVTEAAFGVDERGPNSGAPAHCKQNGEADQRNLFKALVDQVRTTATPVQRLVWFSIIDKRKRDGAKCREPSWYEGTFADDGQPVASEVNTLGLFRRGHDGSLPAYPVPPNPTDTDFRRPLAIAFRSCEVHTDATCSS